MDIPELTNYLQDMPAAPFNFMDRGDNAGRGMTSVAMTDNTREPQERTFINFSVEKIRNGFLLQQTDSIRNKVFSPTISNLNNILIEAIKAAYREAVIKEGESI